MKFGLLKQHVTEIQNGTRVQMIPISGPFIFVMICVPDNTVGSIPQRISVFEQYISATQCPHLKQSRRYLRLSIDSNPSWLHTSQNLPMRPCTCCIDWMQLQWSSSRLQFFLQFHYGRATHFVHTLQTLNSTTTIQNDTHYSSSYFYYT
jgi:hypothetical protein